MPALSARAAPGLAALIPLLAASGAHAKPIAPVLYCEVYPTAPVCLGGTPACTQCHDGAPPARNPYGQAVEALILPGAQRPLSDADFMGALAPALSGVEGQDSDGDGFGNGDEISAGTHPGDRVSHPDPSSCPPFNRDGDWDVCFYDPDFVFKKVRLDFCGRSPTYTELLQFRDQPDPAAALAATLDACLDSEFWLGKNGQLWQLAHAKIRPLAAIKAGEDGGQIPLADYYDDYNLFAYAHSDDHDVRSMLTADFFVVRSGLTYEQSGTATGEQGVIQARRAGLLTTRWNLIYNVMFTALPRTAAAQAYRGLLGLDIAKLEGLFPVPSEPRDYDGKGVADQEACRNCHSTLDPLAYPFRNYNGLTGRVGTYEAGRIERRFADEAPNITMMPEAGSIFGQAVRDLREWAQVAASSDQFARAVVKDHWQLLLGEPPRASQQAEFDRLWQGLKDPAVYDYRVERMLHDLIKTEAYGVP